MRSAAFCEQILRGGAPCVGGAAEFRFARFVPLASLTREPTLREALGDRTLYVRGSVDLLCEYPDGRITVADYKTDRISRAEQDDPTLLAARRPMSTAPSWSSTPPLSAKYTDVRRIGSSFTRCRWARRWRYICRLYKVPAICPSSPGRNSGEADIWRVL